MRRALVLATVLGLAAAAPTEARRNAMILTSSAFQDGGAIPARFTCDGENVSPPLAWSDLPAGTRALALIADDPDAGAQTWVHWVLFNLPPTPARLLERLAPHATLPSGARHGHNDFKQLGYGGPCPPSGTHRYFFKLYALDRSLELPAGATKEALLAAMQGHVLGESQLLGTYRRR